ncbi:MAG TPA: Clp1/GlmU family protein [Chthonomonadaceae bacterium]|nr:Clp1/GlmU family protein [Chthonomonadaceae bacterium]
MTDAATYPEWEETVTTLVEAGGKLMLLGGTDVGKTTFTRVLVNRAVEAGKRVAIVDADVGQSEIGPPTCVGLAFAEAPVLALSDLTPHALAFVGSASPVGYLLEHVAAVKRLADLAASPFLIVDTCGYLHGSGARRLHQTTFDLLAPDHVVALQRQDELQPILAPLRRRDGCRVHTPPIPAVIGRKPPAFRAQRRAMRFAAHFQNAQLHTYAFEDVALIGTWMGSGTPLASHLLLFLNQTLSPYGRVYYAEQCERHLGLMVSHPIPPNAPEIGMALQQLKAKEVSITIAPRLRHLILGLEGANGKLLGLGLLEGLDFRRRTLGVLTPVRAPSAARILRLGALRIRADGSEIGTLRPGDL